MPTVYAALDDRLLVASVWGEDWELQERLAGERIQCLAASSATPERVLVGTFESGLHRSEDGGETFERVGDGTLHEAVMALAHSPHDSEELWAGTEPSAVFHSTDGGDTWRETPPLTDLPSSSEWYFPPRPHTHHVRWIEPDPTDPDRLYVGIEAGAFLRSLDGGESWLDRPDGARVDNHSLATHPDEPGRVYAAAGDGYAESTDGGETWSYPQDGLGHRYCWSVEPDPADPDTVVLSSASGPRSAHSAASAESFVYRREGREGHEGRDGPEDDAPWERAMDGLPPAQGATRATLATTGRTGEFYALSNRGLFRSTDAGRSWADVGLPWRDEYRDGVSRGLVVVPQATTRTHTT